MSNPVRLMVCVALPRKSEAWGAAVCGKPVCNRLQRRTRLEPRHSANGLLHAWGGVRLTVAATLGTITLGGLNKCDGVCMDGLIFT
jgi:hypothetical protein